MEDCFNRFAHREGILFFFRFGCIAFVRPWLGDLKAVQSVFLFQVKTRQVLHALIAIDLLHRVPMLGQRTHRQSDQIIVILRGANGFGESVGKRDGHAALSSDEHAEGGQILGGEGVLLAGRNGIDHRFEKCLDHFVGLCVISGFSSCSPFAVLAFGFAGKIPGKLITIYQRIAVIAGAVEADDAHHPRAGLLPRIEVIHGGVEIHLHVDLVRGNRMGDLAGTVCVASRLLGQHAAEKGDVGGSLGFLEGSRGCFGVPDSNRFSA